jgi:hypothetical protein
MSYTQVYPVNMSSSPKGKSLFDPFGGENNQKDSNSMLVWWIIISIVTFFIMLIVNIFFVYVPISRMEEKFDATAQKLDDVGVFVKDAADGVDTIIKDVEELGKIAVSEFDKVKGGICLWLRAEGIDFPFCSESGVNEVLASSNTNGRFTSRRSRNELGTSKCRF